MYYGIYKCRLCKETYKSCATGSSDIVVKQFIGINTPMKQLQQVDLTDMHSCKDGSFGLSDFQGFAKTEE